MTAPDQSATEGQPMLPGLEPAQLDSAMVSAAKRNLAALQRDGLLTDRHELLTTLVLSLADAIDKGARSGRASAVALAAAQLRETMLVLDPPPEDGGAGTEGRQLLETFMAEVERAANTGQVGR